MVKKSFSNSHKNFDGFRISVHLAVLEEIVSYTYICLPSDFDSIDILSHSELRFSNLKIPFNKNPRIMLSDSKMQNPNCQIGHGSSDLHNNLGSSNAVLRTEDGQRFDVSTDLANRSPYFKALFCGSFGDGTDILLKGIASKTLETILFYLNTGTIHLNKEDATDILIASDYLLIDPLVQEAKSFVLKEMNPTNCFKLLLTALKYEHFGILNDCHRFNVIHFEEVVSQVEEIGVLPSETLKKFLREKTLSVTSERTVWNVIVRWIEFDLPDRLIFIPDLVRYISLEDVDERLLSDILTHDMVLRNKFCQRLVFSELYQIANVQNFRKTLKAKNITTGPRIPNIVHLVVDYWITSQSFNKNIFLTHDGDTDYWRKVGSVSFFPAYLIQVGRCVYIFENLIQKSLAFDLLEEKFLPMTPIFKARRSYSAVALNGFIYVMGGFIDIFKHIEDIERFDPRTNKWILVSRMVPMCVQEAVAVNGNIYAIGYGKRRMQLNLMVQMYDPATDYWSYVYTPKISMPQVNAFVYSNNLYLLSGESRQWAPRRVDKYDPKRYAWIRMPDLPIAYHTPRAIVLKGVLIIHEDLVNRIQGGNTPPIYWNQENQKWNIMKESDPLYIIHLFKFCTITESNVVKGILKRNMQEREKFFKSPLV